MNEYIFLTSRLNILAFDLFVKRFHFPWLVHVYMPERSTQTIYCSLITKGGLYKMKHSAPNWYTVYHGTELMFAATSLKSVEEKLFELGILDDNIMEKIKNKKL